MTIGPTSIISVLPEFLSNDDPVVNVSPFNNDLFAKVTIGSVQQPVVCSNTIDWLSTYRFFFQYMTYALWHDKSVSCNISHYKYVRSQMAFIVIISNNIALYNETFYQIAAEKFWHFFRYY